MSNVEIVLVAAFLGFFLPITITFVYLGKGIDRPFRQAVD